MKVLNGKLPERLLRGLAKRPMLVISGLSLSMKLGKDGLEFGRGKIDGPEMRRRAGASVGGVGLGAAGSYAGLVAGHFLVPVPMLGGVLGGFAGGALGEMLGGKLGRRAVERAEAALGPRGDPAAQAPPAEDDVKNDASYDAEADAPPEGAAKPPPRRHI